jgi:3-oxoacyl-[acyl-carrier-protein] synthase II
VVRQVERRVVVTGMGMISPVGRDTESSWKKLREGHSGVGPVTLFDASTFATRIAGEVTNFRLSDYRPDAARWVEHSRTTQLALAAATLAVEQSGLNDGQTLDRSRFGVYLGSGEGQQDFGGFAELVYRSSKAGRVDTAHFTRLGLQTLHPVREGDQEPGSPAGHLAAVFGASGPNATCQTACAASAQAIGEATELIRWGDADVMLAGGAHSMVHPLGLTGFILLTAMSTRNDDPERASRPFDRDRDGFVLGEGGGVLVLEELEHARNRRATIFGEILGHCSTADAFRLTDSHNEGRGAIAAMKGALEDAMINPEDVDYINAHGTSTPSNDSIETLAIKRVFGHRAYRVPISSTKSMTGHLVSAGGAVEAIACLYAIKDGVLPPTINLENHDPECDLDYVPNAAREQMVNTVLSNSFGFGGQNTSLVIGRFTG